MTKLEAIAKLKEIQTNSEDPDIDHRKSDCILCELLCSLDCEDVVKEFSKIEKWYS